MYNHINKHASLASANQTKGHLYYVGAASWTPWAAWSLEPSPPFYTTDK